MNGKSTISIVLFVFSLSLHASDSMFVSLGKLPVVAESREKGTFIEYTKRLGAEMPIKVDYDVYPFVRSLQNIANGKADMHLPFIVSPGGEKMLTNMGLEYAQEPFLSVVFALYYQKSNTNIKQWIDSNFSKEKNNNFQFETESGHLMFFENINIKGNPCLACMVGKLNKNRLDGVIFAAREIDDIVAAKQYVGIDSVLFRVFQFSAVFKNDEKGRRLNAQVSKITLKFKKSGELDKIMKPFTDYYYHRFPKFKQIMTKTH